MAPPPPRKSFVCPPGMKVYGSMSGVLQHTYTGTKLFPVVTSPDPAAKASMDTDLPSAGSKAGSSGDKNAAIEPEAIERTSKARIGHNPRASSQAGGVALSGQGPEGLTVIERRQCRMPDAPSENTLARRKAMMDSTFATAAEEERLRWRRSLWSFLATAPSMDLVGTWLLENAETLNTPFGHFGGYLLMLHCLSLLRRPRV